MVGMSILLLRSAYKTFTRVIIFFFSGKLKFCMYEFCVCVGLFCLETSNRGGVMGAVGIFL